MTGNVDNRSVAVAPSTKVQVYTSEFVLDPNYYVVESQDRNIVMLKMVCSFCTGTGNVRNVPCKECKGTGTGARHRVHQTRIAKVFDQDGNTVYESPTLGKEKQMTTSQKPKTATTVPVTEAVNFKELKTQGELFSKAVEFDHSAIKVEAHVLIAPDKRSFRVFNTYNETLGKKGRAGKSYPLADDKAYERKVNQLRKQGYKKR